jgi:hypothetical protein
MNKRKVLNVAVALIASCPGLAIAATAVSTSCSTDARAVSTTYYNCVGSTHNGLDITNGSCAEWNLRGMLQGAYYYTYYGSCANTCTDSTCNNLYVVNGANGWDFRQLYVYANANSYSKTCDGCVLGLVGSSHGTPGLTHADNRQYGTRKTAWYSAKVTCGANIMCGSVVGYPTL